MHILTGRFCGQPIRFKANPSLRPTSDKVRQAIFNMLKGSLENKKVLDLFGGTGAIGIEALSCGASEVTFVEIEKKQATKISENLEALGVDSQACVLSMDAIQAINLLSEDGKKYDIVFLDPPYEKDLGLKAVRALAASKILNEGSLVFLECEKRHEALESAGSLKAIKIKIYGDTKIIVYKETHA